METTPFDLTTEQKDLLKSLSQETGKSISVLITEALQGLCEQVRPGSDNGAIRHRGEQGSVLDVFRPSWEAIPDEELDRLPTDLASQVDHYVYGLPKRTT